MADSPTTVPQLDQNTAAHELIVNCINAGLAPSLLYARNDLTSHGLTWNYFGGWNSIAGVPTLNAGGTLTLTASTTAYIRKLDSTGVVSFVTSIPTAWPALNGGYTPLYDAVVGASGPTSWKDYRSANLFGAQSGGSAPPSGTAGGDLAGTYPNPTVKTSVSLTTPVLNVATATSINKVAITAPATSATLTVADGKTLTASNSITIAGTDAKTLTVSNSLTLAGTDSTVMTFPPASASVGYINIPQGSHSAAYTTVLADAGKHMYHPASDANARTFTIDSNANVAYPLGTAITFVNRPSQVLSIAITSDTMTLANTTTTGTRSLAQNGVATAIKVETTEWVISGTGLT